MKLLVVEDSEILGSALARGLKAAGFVVDLAKRAEDALLLLISTEYDAIVLDWMLPGMSGVEFLRRVRQGECSQVPVLMLSAKSEVHDKITGLDIGADDYMPKPFDFGELVARVRALCRRGPGRRAPCITLGRLSLDTSAHSVEVDAEPVALTKSEYSILESLVLRRGETLTKDWLVERLHDADGYATTNSVEVFVSSLRKKLRACGLNELIRTQRGLGYLIPHESDRSRARAES